MELYASKDILMEFEHTQFPSIHADAVLHRLATLAAHSLYDRSNFLPVGNFRSKTQIVQDTLDSLDRDVGGT